MHAIWTVVYLVLWFACYVRGLSTHAIWTVVHFVLQCSLYTNVPLHVLCTMDFGLLCTVLRCTLYCGVLCTVEYFAALYRCALCI